MARSERETTDPSIDAAFRYLQNKELPSDQEFGTIIDGVFVLNPRKEVQTTVPRIGPVRKLLRTTGALLNF